MDPAAKVWWCTDVVHLLYSAGVSVAAATYLVLQPGALSVASPPVATGVPDALVCISAGFCAFLLWILLAYRYGCKQHCTCWAVSLLERSLAGESAKDEQSCHRFVIRGIPQLDCLSTTCWGLALQPDSIAPDQVSGLDSQSSYLSLSEFSGLVGAYLPPSTVV